MSYISDAIADGRFYDFIDSSDSYEQIQAKVESGLVSHDSIVDVANDLVYIGSVNIDEELFDVQGAAFDLDEVPFGMQPGEFARGEIPAAGTGAYQRMFQTDVESIAAEIIERPNDFYLAL